MEPRAIIWNQRACHGKKVNNPASTFVNTWINIHQPSDLLKSFFFQILWRSLRKSKVFGVSRQGGGGEQEETNDSSLLVSSTFLRNFISWNLFLCMFACLFGCFFCVDVIVGSLRIYEFVRVDIFVFCFLVLVHFYICELFSSWCIRAVFWYACICVLFSSWCICAVFWWRLLAWG